METYSDNDGSIIKETFASTKWPYMFNQKSTPLLWSNGLKSSLAWDGLSTASEGDPIL